jgi:hypothetical protein
VLLRPNSQELLVESTRTCGFATDHDVQYLVAPLPDVVGHAGLAVVEKPVCVDEVIAVVGYVVFSWV